jgi:hypothetical protein
MKKNIIAFCLLALGFTTSTYASVNEKVLASFKSTFPNAQGVNWEEYKDRCVVNFTEHGIRSRINYDMDGNLLRAIRYYSAENLPLNVLTRLRKNFPNQQIFGVTEVATDYSTQFYIKLKDANTWTTVVSDESGNMEVTESYKDAAK